MKIDIVRYLLDEIETEQDRQKRYDAEDALASTKQVVASPVASEAAMKGEAEHENA